MFCSFKIFHQISPLHSSLTIFKLLISKTGRKFKNIFLQVIPWKNSGRGALILHSRVGGSSHWKGLEVQKQIINYGSCEVSRVFRSILHAYEQSLDENAQN